MMVLARARYGTLVDKEDMREKTNEGAYHTFTASSASLSTIDRQHSNHFLLLSIVAKKSNIWWWHLLGFVPVIVGSENNNTPTKKHGTAQARANRMQRLLLIKATIKNNSWVGFLLLFFLQAKSSVTFAQNINNSFIQPPAIQGTKKAKSDPCCSVRCAYVQKICLVRTQQQ